MTVIQISKQLPSWQTITCMTLVVCVGLTVSCNKATGTLSTLPRPNITRLTNIMPEVEAEQWRRIRDHLMDDTFFPEAFKGALTNAEKQQHIIRFREYRAIRSKGLSSRSSKDEIARYQTLYVISLRNQLRVLTALIDDLERRQTLAARSQPTKDYSEADLKERIRRLDLDRRYLERATQTSEARRRAPLDTTTEERPRRERVLCVQTQQALMYCITEAEIADAFMSGHWSRTGKWITDRFDEARAYGILNQLDKAAARLRKPRNTLFFCAGGDSFALDTAGPDPVQATAFGETDPDLPSVPEMAGMAASCNFAALLKGRVGRPGSGGGLGGWDSNWVKDTVSQIDQEIARCGGNQAGGMEEGGGIVNTILGEFLPGKVGTFVEALTLPNDIGAEATQDLKDDYAGNAQYSAMDARWDADAFAANAAKVAKDAEDADAVAGDAEKRARDNPDDPDAKAEAEAARQYADDKKREAAQASEEAKRKEEEAKKAEEEADKAARDAGEPKAAGGGGGDEGASVCAGIKAKWEFFKAMCDSSDGWDRRGTACNLFLRRKRGCMDSDPRVTDPNPEGGNLDRCMAASPTAEEMIKAGCELRRTFESAAEFLDGSCDIQMRSVIRSPRGDICSNPAAMPADDQCAGGEFPLPRARAHSPVGGPQPRPNGAMLGHMQIVDGLGLNGLGFGRPPSASYH